MKNKGKNIISTIIMVIAIYALVNMYQNYNFNDFVKSVRQVDITNFSRDKDVTFEGVSSYKIENPTYNDAMFYQTIDVTPNTPYKVTCKIKTKNVVNEKNLLTGGAHISLAGTTLASPSITGTKDWQEVTLMFNSQDDIKVDIGFRLGGYEEKSKGTAWFTDFKVERGSKSSGNKWKFACFIFPQINVDVNFNGKKQHINLQMTDTDIQDIRVNMQRFQTSIKEMSKNKMQIDYDLFTINNAITTLSYDEDNGYYVSPQDVYKFINSYVEKNEYDHIYVAIRMADIQKGSDVLESDWIGLGGMDYFGIGYSNIRLPDDEQNYAYKFNYRYNTFPEEVFIHEFLHTLERNAKEYGYEIPALHDYVQYGYSNELLTGQKKWYEDYMNCNINYLGKKIGLPKEVFNYKPVHQANFKHSYELDVMQEPDNIFEILNGLLKRMGKTIDYLKNKE